MPEWGSTGRVGQPRKKRATRKGGPEVRERTDHWEATTTGTPRVAPEPPMRNRRDPRPTNTPYLSSPGEASSHSPA